VTTEALLLYAVIWLVCAVGAYLIAASKKADNPGTWGIIGLLLGPIGLAGAAILAKPAPAVAEGRPTTAVSGAGQAPTGSLCGRCGKVLSPVWRGKCNHCGATYAEFPPVARA